MLAKSRSSSVLLSQAGALASALLGGLISGVFVVVLAVSLATLVYADTWPQFAGRAIAFVLVGTASLTFILALTSSYPGTIALTQDSPAAILAISIPASIRSIAGASPEEQFYTAVATILLTTVAVGVMMFLLGHFRLGRMIRFIPYSVIGGFLAATGWVLLRGGIEILIELPDNFAALPELVTLPMLIRWLPGVIVALALLVLLRRYRSAVLAPVLLVAGTLIFHAILLITQTPLDRAAELQLLVGPFPDGAVWQPPVSAHLLSVDPTHILSRLPGLAPLFVITIVSLLLNCSSLELAVGKDIDLNHELKATGAANVVSGLLGGMPGYHALSVSLITHLIGANGRLVGITAALITASVALAGDQFLMLIPRAILGGLVIFLGLHLLVEWVIDARRKISRADYAIVLAILGVVMFGGYLEGIAVGLLMAVLLFLVDYSRESVVKQVFTGEGYQSTVKRPPDERHYLSTHGKAIHILRLKGYIFFGTANSLLELIQRRLSEADGIALRYVIFDFRLVTNFDTSALMSFARMKQIAQNHRFMLVLAGLNAEMLERFQTFGDILSEETVRLFPDLDHAVEWCENQLLRDASIQVRANDASLVSELEKHMPRETADAIMEVMECMRLQAGERLVQQGESAGSMFFIESGLLSVQVEFETGNAIRVRTATSGAVLGEIGFYLDTQRTATIMAEEPSVVYVLTRPELIRLEQEQPVAAAALHRFLAGRLAQALADNAAFLREALA